MALQPQYVSCFIWPLLEKAKVYIKMGHQTCAQTNKFSAEYMYDVHL